MEEQTGTEMVLEEQKEIAETQDSTLGEQQSDAPEITTAQKIAQRKISQVLKRRVVLRSVWAK